MVTYTIYITLSNSKGIAKLDKLQKKKKAPIQEYSSTKTIWRDLIRHERTMNFIW